VPELPEVETIVRDIAPTLTGSTLHHPRLSKTDVLSGVTKARLLRALDGNTVQTVSRRAKHVVIRFDDGLRMVVQPGMTGSLVIHRARLTRGERKYAVLRVDVGRDATLVYRDVRRFGRIYLLDEPAWSAYTGRIGPEPLEDGFTVARFLECIRGSRQAIKKVLMDQQRIAGVGNIYANEALFRAKIDPSHPANRLDRNALTRLHRAVRRVLLEALEGRGTTLRDYRTGTGQRGSFQFSLKVYGREGEPCVRCGTDLVATHDIDARQTTFCPRCQERV